jgi:hypothetical protein
MVTVRVSVSLAGAAQQKGCPLLTAGAGEEYKIYHACSGRR